jgi:hypothetical protein
MSFCCLPMGAVGGPGLFGRRAVCRRSVTAVGGPLATVQARARQAAAEGG